MDNLKSKFSNKATKCINILCLLTRKLAIFKPRYHRPSKKGAILEHHKKFD